MMAFGGSVIFPWWVFADYFSFPENPYLVHWWVLRISVSLLIAFAGFLNYKRLFRSQSISASVYSVACISTLAMMNFTLEPKNLNLYHGLIGTLTLGYFVMNRCELKDMAIVVIVNWLAYLTIYALNPIP